MQEVKFLNNVRSWRKKDGLMKFKNSVDRNTDDSDKVRLANDKLRIVTFREDDAKKKKKVSF
jgi:hypothetical protein